MAMGHAGSSPQFARNLSTTWSGSNFDLPFQERFMKRGLVLCAIFAVAGLGAAQAQESQVNVICSAAAEWCSLAQAAYSKSSGVKVNMVQKSTGEARARIVGARANPKTD